jgi:PTS system N-acetylglucosamine-specific IIB component
VHDPDLVDVTVLRAAGAHGVMISGRVVQVVVGPSVDTLATDLEELM